MLLSLFPELRVVVARKLCVRDLVRLSRVSKQLNALCVDVGERAVQEMIAAGEDDAPLPAGLSEHVLHRLARLCGVRFVPAAFADAVFEASLNHYTDVTWDLAALEKAYVVLSERELEPYRSTIPGYWPAVGEWRFKVEPDYYGDDSRRRYYWDSPDAAGGAFNFIKSVITFCEHDRDSCIARKHVDRAIDLLYTRGHERSMARSRRLMERATHEDDSNDDGTFLAKKTARQEKDEELDLAREDKLGVLIDQEWWPSCEDYFSKFDVLKDFLYIVRPDLQADPDMNDRPWREEGTAPCSIPLCCHTWRNLRVVGYRSQERSAELMRAPKTGRLRVFDCPRGLKQRAVRAEIRKWCRESRKNAKAVLESLGFAVVEGVRMGDAPSGWNYGVL